MNTDMIADLKRFAGPIKMPVVIVPTLDATDNTEFVPRKLKIRTDEDGISRGRKKKTDDTEHMKREKKPTETRTDNSKDSADNSKNNSKDNSKEQKPITHEDIARLVQPPLFPIRENGKLLSSDIDSSLAARCTEGHIHRYSFHDITTTTLRCQTCTAGTKTIKTIREIVEITFDTGFSYVRKEPQYTLFHCSQYPIALFIISPEHKRWRPEPTVGRYNLAIQESKGVRSINIMLHDECKQLVERNIASNMLPEKVIARINGLIPSPKVKKVVAAPTPLVYSDEYSRDKSLHTTKSTGIYFENCREFDPKK